MAALFKIWAVTSWEDYSKNWPSSVGPFNQLTEYQKSLGFTSPEDFFTKQSIAAQNLANDKIANLLERVFSTTDLSEKVQFQLRKFTYQAIDFLRMNDSIIAENVRQSQTTINNQRLDSTFVNIDSVEGLVGAAAWRSWKLASLEKLYHSWAQTKGIEYLLDPTRFYDKEEMDYKLSLIDDQIQVQQTLIDGKLTEFNAEMETKLSVFRDELNDDPDLIANIGDNLEKNDDFISQVAHQIDDSLVDKGYVDEQLAKKVDNTVLTTLETKTDHSNDIKINISPFILKDNRDGKLSMPTKAILTNVSDPKNSLDAVNKQYVDNATTTIKTAANDLTKRVDVISDGIEKIFYHEVNIAANTNFTYEYDVFLEGNGYYLLDFSISTGGQNNNGDYNASGSSMLVRVVNGQMLDYYIWTPGTTNRDTPQRWYILFLNFFTSGTLLGIRTFKYIDGSTFKDPIQAYTFRILAKKISGLPAFQKVETYEQKEVSESPIDELVKEETESER